ncbi:MAG TPA: hypothetical protein ACFCUC_05210 [Desulfobacterales bacterium]
MSSKKITLPKKTTNSVGATVNSSFPEKSCIRIEIQLGKRNHGTQRLPAQPLEPQRAERLPLPDQIALAPVVQRKEHRISKAHRKGFNFPFDESD